MFLKGAAIALALAGATFATAGTSNAAGVSFGITDNGRHNSSTAMSFNFGEVAFAYQDGYWDNNRRWHKWRNRRDHDNYRKQYSNKYRNGNHTRYSGQGWQRR
ncbi:MAG TPA: hypothetical protein VGC27_13885 [Rhizomicrobium sp.]